MKIRKKLLFDRTLEIFYTGTAVSVVTGIINYFFKYNYIVSSILFVVAPIVFFVLSFLQLRTFRISINGKNRYYKYNIIAFSIYCGFATIFALAVKLSSGGLKSVLNGICYFLFFIFKIPRWITYSQYNPDYYTVGNVTAVVIFSAICMLLVIVAPFFINKSKIVFEESKLK